MQRDPLGYVDGSNVYGYTTSNPIDYTDPFGLTVLCPGCSLMAQCMLNCNINSPRDCLWAEQNAYKQAFGDCLTILVGSPFLPHSDEDEAACRLVAAIAAGEALSSCYAVFCEKGFAGGLFGIF